MLLLSNKVTTTSSKTGSVQVTSIPPDRPKNEMIIISIFMSFNNVITKNIKKSEMIIKVPGERKKKID